ncbi:TolB family protein [Mucilaginibacter sp. McL0603]|uniref:TolB family protein n=1 Tax=Mucilaginibacter sp. McL0603 TaxID=3415670 RepID=UPI003CF46D5D
MSKSIQFPISLPFFKPAGVLFFCLLLSASVFAQSKRDTTSYIQTVDIKTGKIDTVLIAKGDYEAPNWHPDNYLVLNFRGKMYKLDLAAKALTEINTGSINQNMDDHGLSPDGKWIAITSFDMSNPSQKGYKFSISIVPAAGGQPRKIITSQDLSFWHGWSPDGKTLAYCGGDFSNLDVYTIPVEGGTPKRLTETPGLDDGPDYSPDGKYIYFHSYRTGHMQIWRMHPDGSQPEQMTFDENANWFPHPSPNNKWIAYIAYTTDEKQNHPFGKNVKLRLMDLKTKAIKDITPVFYGGAGTINTPSWSPDNKKIAFVSYSVN